MSTRGGRDYPNGRQRAGSATQAPRSTLRQRGAEATRALRTALNLPPDISDNTILSTALAEIAAEEVQCNPGFARNVRSRYDELIATHGRPVTRKAPAQALPPLVPIGHVPGYHVDPFNAPDPHFLVRLYGHDQLARALYDYTVDMLKETAAQLEREHPGTKPDNRGRRDALIAYIVEQTPAS